MITFNNPNNIHIFSSFKTEFDEILRNKFSSDSIVINGINEKHQMAQCITLNNDPFATNTIIKPYPILINEVICKELKLTERECFSMIAHEIGHIIDSTPRIGNEFQREINADLFAVELGFIKELKTGLSKIIESGKYDKEVNNIKERIIKLSDADEINLMDKIQ